MGGLRSWRVLAIAVNFVLALAGCADDDGGPPISPPDAGADGTAADARVDCTDTDCSFLDAPCARGLCDPATGACVPVPRIDGASCDDGDACTTADRCEAGVCVGDLRDCSGVGGPCVAGLCDPATGECLALPLADGTSCDDGDLCTVTDRCAGGVCAGEALDCSVVADACSAGMCDPATGGCLAVPFEDGAVCDDGDPCTSGETCESGVCVGEAVDCSDLSDACNAGVCDPTSGTCGLALVSDGTLCSFDADSCTIDECGAGMCGATRTWCGFLSTPADGPTEWTGAPPSSVDRLEQLSCGPGELIVGLEGTTSGSGLASVRAICARPTLRGDNPFQVALVEVGDTRIAGRFLGTSRRASCPPSHAVVGFDVGVGSYNLLGVELRCAPLSVALADTELAVRLGATRTNPFRWYVGYRRTGSRPTTQCPTGATVDALSVRVRGASIGAIRPSCVVPSLSGGVTRMLDACDAEAAVVDRHAGTACRNLAVGGASYVDLADDVAAVTLYQQPDCAGPSVRLLDDAALCGLTYDGTDIDVNDNVGSYRLEY